MGGVGRGGRVEMWSMSQALAINTVLLIHVVAWLCVGCDVAMEQ